MAAKSKIPLCLAALALAASARAQSNPNNMPSPSLPLAGTEIIPCLQSNGYKKCTTAEIGQTLLSQTPNVWTGKQVFSLNYPATTYPVISGVNGDGLVSARTQTMLQIVGAPNLAVSPEVNNVDSVAYNGFASYDAERYDRGTATTNGTTSTSSNTLHFAATPSWVAATALVSDATTGNAVGTVLSTTGTTIVLAANSASNVGNGDVLVIVGPNNGAVQNAEPIGVYAFEPYDGVSDAATAGMNALTTQTQDWTTDHHGTAVQFFFTPNSAGTNKRYIGITMSNGGNGGVTIGDTSYQVPPTDMGARTLNVAGSLYVGNGHLIATSAHLHGEQSGTPVVNNSGVVNASSTDNAGEITGGSAATSWSVGWNTNWSTRPFCSVTPLSTAGGAYSISATVSSLTVTFTNSNNAGFDWVCL